MRLQVNAFILEHGMVMNSIYFKQIRLSFKY